MPPPPPNYFLFPSRRLPRNYFYLPALTPFPFCPSLFVARQSINNPDRNTQPALNNMVVTTKYTP
jgi:hypothetical protein